MSEKVPVPLRWHSARAPYALISREPPEATSSRLSRHNAVISALQRHCDVRYHSVRLMLTRRATLQSMLAAASAGLAGVAPGAPRARRPNFIILLADDLGYGDVGCFGSPDVPTPNIDGIAERGVRFTDGYVTCPVCSPSRSAVMTGRYQERYGHEFNPEAGPKGIGRDIKENLGLPLSEITLPQLLKPAGYATGIVGKWHLGSNPPFHPLARGFDEYFGFLGPALPYVSEETPDEVVAVAALDSPGMEKVPRWAPVLRGREVVNERQYLTDALGREAVSFIERHKQEPFFLYLAFNAIHVPFQVTRRYLDRVANIPNERHRVLAAMTVALDVNIGRVLNKLRQSGLDNDTLVFFFSDNGCPTYSGAGTNGPLSGAKCTLFEGGIRVPFCMQWPGHVPGRQVYRHPIMSFDLLSTFTKLAGVELPRDRQYDGVNLIPHLAGKISQPPHPRLFWRAGRNAAMRQGNWKLLQLGEDRTHLYDLAIDLAERHDRSSEHPELVKEMRAVLKDWSTQMIAPRWSPQASPNLPVNGENITWDV
jgi:arylsulfatase A-like enzyme